MPKMEKFPHGTPAWVDLQSPDQEASKHFYARLFGWKYEENPMTSGYMYSTATVDGSPVAAIAPQAPEAVQVGITTAWTTYFAVEDVDAALEKVAPAGGRVIMGADDVEGFGRTALVEDSIGAPFALWRANTGTRPTLINEPGSFVWHELAAGNWEHAVPFYLEVLGAEAVEEQMDGGSFTMLKAAGEYVAGFRGEINDETTPHWEVYFSVADVDAGVIAAQKAGAAIVTEPYGVEGVGRMAMLQDPQGAVFWILQEPTEEKNERTSGQ